MDSGPRADWERSAAPQFHIGMNVSRDGGDASETAFTDGTRSCQDTCPVTLSRTVYMTGNAANTLARWRGSGADVTLSGDRQRQQDKQRAAHLRQRHHFAIP